MTADKRKCTFFNVIMKRSHEDSLGLQLSGGSATQPVCITNVAKGSLAEACGLRKGDRVDMVNGVRVASMTIPQVLQLVATTPRIHLQIQRNSGKKGEVATVECNDEGEVATVECNDEEPNFSNLCKSASVECQVRRKKERSCGSFMNRIFRSRSQDQCRKDNSSAYGSTIRSSSMIVHLSNNLLSSSQSTLRKSNRLSSCMKLFKSKGLNEDAPGIDVSLVSPNNAYKQPPSMDSAFVQESCEYSTTPPICLKVINSQISPQTTSRAIVNISPTLKILNITASDESPVSKPLACYILNYTEPESIVCVNKSIEEQQSEIENNVNLKSTLPLSISTFDNVSTLPLSISTFDNVSTVPLSISTFDNVSTLPLSISTFDNVSSMNTNVNLKVSDEIMTDHECRVVPITTLYNLPQRSDYRECWTKDAKVPDAQARVCSTSKATETTEKLENGNEVDFKLINKSRKPTDFLKTQNMNKELKKFHAYESDLTLMIKDGHFLQNNNNINKEVPKVPPKRNMKNVIPCENVLHITKTKKTTIINSCSALKSTASTKDNLITTTASTKDNLITTTASLYCKDIIAADMRRLIHSAEEKEKLALDEILDNALLDLSADASLSKTMQDNTHFTISSAQKSSKAFCQYRNYDDNINDSQNIIYTSSPVSAADNLDKYISNAEIVQKDNDKETNNINFITNESLILYSINNNLSDASYTIKSPDSGISSILSPSDLNDRLLKTTLKSNDYEFINLFTANKNCISNTNVSQEDKPATYNNFASEMITRDGKLVNVVTPSSVNEGGVQPLDEQFQSILKRKSDDLVGFNAFNRYLASSEIEMNPSFNVKQNNGEIDSVKEQTNVSHKFTDEYGKPIIKPPSYDSVAYFGDGQTRINSTSNNHTRLYDQHPIKADITFSARKVQEGGLKSNEYLINSSQEGGLKSNEYWINSSQDYDNLKSKEIKLPNPNISHTQDGIYEQIPAHKSHSFANKKNIFNGNNMQMFHLNQTSGKDVFIKRQDDSQKFQELEKCTNEAAKLCDYVKRQQFHRNNFSDSSEKDLNQGPSLKDQSNREGSRCIGLRRDEVIDELKQTFIGDVGASKAFYATTAPQPFTPINQHHPPQWAFNDISNLSSEASNNAAWGGFRENYLFQDEIENEDRMEDMHQIEKQRMFIKGIHQARRNNTAERLVHETLYENMQQPAHSRMTKYRGKAAVLHNFRARKPVELSLRKGDTVFLLRKIDKNWVEGEHHNTTGIFPLSFVQIIESLEDAEAAARIKEGSAIVLYDFHPRSPLELSLKKGYVVTLVRRIDDNWYEGRFGERRGIFPSNYVVAMREPDTPLPTPCVTRMTTPQPGWQSPSAASTFSIDLPSACPSDFNADFSRLSTPLGGSILEGFMPGVQTLPRSFSALSAPLRNIDHNNNANHGSQLLRTPSMIEEEFDEFAPQKPVLQRGTFCTMSRLNNRIISVPQYNRHIRLNYQREQAQPHLRNIKISETLGRTNLPSKASRTPNYEAGFNKNFQNNQLMVEKNAVNRTGLKVGGKLNEQQILKKSNEREINTLVKPIIYPRYRALHNFDARASEEISLRKDEVVRVVERCRDGWIIGFLEATRKFGLFPGNFVEPLR